MAWQAGQSLHGNRYTIERRLGRGGFGITYLAKDRRGQPWVIKTLRDDILEDPQYAPHRDKFLSDFKDEALKLGYCRHRHIVEIEGFFTHEGRPCLVMEYVPGQDLDKLIRAQGKLSEAAALRYARQIGAALRVIHDKGVLHRDLKPENILIRANRDEAVLIDFGIAREFLPGITQTQTTWLTPGFAPIEQYDQRARRGEYTDVYALAATLLYALTGELLPPAFMRAIRDELAIPQTLSPNLQRALAAGLRLKPEERVPTVATFLQQLEPPQPKQPAVRQAASPLDAVPLESEKGADYRQLRELLRQQEWRKADEETIQLMLQVAGRTKAGWLNVDSIKKFPCADLRTLDRLWVAASGGKFGFSVQKEIWLKLGGQVDYETEKKLGDAVGWRKNGK